MDKVQIAIDRLRTFEPPEGYFLAFSGGKDSIAIKRLADMAGVKYDAHYHHTTVDPPELVYFIRSFPDVERHLPRETMWQLIVRKKMPPTRLIRYCCSELKEKGGAGRIVVSGVRWAESVRRRQTRTAIEIVTSGQRNKIILNNDNDEARKLFENCRLKGKRMVNPIIDWLDEDVWEFIRTERLPYCNLYDEGFQRLGCIGCPMAGTNRKREFDRYPSYYNSYLKAFEKMLAARKESGMATAWRSAEEVMRWWMQEKNMDRPPIDGQLEWTI